MSESAGTGLPLEAYYILYIVLLGAVILRKQLPQTPLPADRTSMMWNPFPFLNTHYGMQLMRNKRRKTQRL